MFYRYAFYVRGAVYKSPVDYYCGDVFVITQLTFDCRSGVIGN